MQPHGGARAGFIFRRDRFDKARMLPLPGQNAVPRLDQRQIAVKRNTHGDLGLKCGERGDEKTIAGRLGYGPMQGEVFFDAKRALLDHPVELRQRVANPAKSLGIVIAGGQCRGFALDRDPEHETALDIGDAVEWRVLIDIVRRPPDDERTRALALCNQAIFAQPHQRFAHDGPGDAELIGKTGFGGKT